MDKKWMSRPQSDTPVPHVRLCNIICTIGPSSRDVGILVKMMEAGMNIARLHLSFDTQQKHTDTIAKIREADKIFSEKLGYRYPIAIALDLKGPEIRTGSFENNVRELTLKANEPLTLTTAKDTEKSGNIDFVYVDYPNLINVVFPGHRINFDYGEIILVVKEVITDCVICEITKGGVLSPYKIVHLLDIHTDLPVVTMQDKSDIAFAIEQDVDYIFIPYVKNAKELAEFRGTIGEKGKHIKVIAKIDCQEGLTNLDDIIKATDGIIVSRSSLAMDISPEMVFLAQRHIIEQATKGTKPVICSTQILDSMMKSLHPSRHEISDIVNIVVDGGDGAMLSGETATGHYPVESVRRLDKILKKAEVAIWHKKTFGRYVQRIPICRNVVHAVSIAACEAAERSRASAIIVITSTGRSAYFISTYRPICPIIAVTRHPRSARQTLMYRGIIPVVYTEPLLPNWADDVDARTRYGLQVGKSNGFVNTHDPVVIVTGWRPGTGYTNTVRVEHAVFEKNADRLLQCLLSKQI